MSRSLYRYLSGVALAGTVWVVACASPDFSATDPKIIDLDAANVSIYGTPSVPLKPAAPAPAASVAAKAPDLSGYRAGPSDQLMFSLYVLGGKEDSKRIYPTNVYSANQGALMAVRQDGTVNFPYVGNVKVDGKTESEMVELLQKKYTRYFKKPDIELRIVEFNANRVTVTGEVAKPGEQPLSHRELTVIQALAASGGVTADADLRSAELRRSGGAVEKLDLQAMLYEGRLEQNRVLASGDSLYIPTNHRNKVFVMGEVVKPRSQSIARGRLTLTEALTESEGLDKITASQSKVYVIRGAVNEAMLEKPADLKTPPPPAAGMDIDPLKVTVYRLDTTSPDAFVIGDRFQLQPRDVVYVSARGITEWSRFISQLIPPSVQSILYGTLFVDNE